MSFIVDLTFTLLVVVIMIGLIFGIIIGVWVFLGDVGLVPAPRALWWRDNPNDVYIDFSAIERLTVIKDSRDGYEPMDPVQYFYFERGLAAYLTDEGKKLELRAKR